MIYVIDHNDSFTHNVVHQFALFDKVECDNYDKINENKIKQASTIIFSPGPGNPKNYPITSKIYKKYKGKKKIIGICLGFQHILFCEGAKIVEQKKIYHGFQSNIKVITNKSLFKKGKIFKVGRYHSLKLKEPFKSNNFEIIKAMMPGGSVIGCPKINTLNLLNNQEKENRNIYTGSFGYIKFNGDMRFNIIIRSILNFKNISEISVASGVVVDSNANHEFNENFLKAKALIDLFK